MREPAQLMPADDLDQLYGLAVQPTRVGAYEHRPQASYLLLDDEGSARFAAYVKASLSGGYLSACLLTDFTMLWLVDESGYLRVALEEAVLMVPEAGNVGTYPLPHLASRELLPRLGHPALVEGGRGRIGGELSYCPAEHRLYVSNRSGRFGLNLGRTESQLNRVAEMFQGIGIQVTVSFEPGGEIL